MNSQAYKVLKSSTFYQALYIWNNSSGNKCYNLKAITDHVLFKAVFRIRFILIRIRGSASRIMAPDPGLVLDPDPDLDPDPT